MATTGHNFSIYANASIRPPIDPKTGFSSTSVDKNSRIGTSLNAVDGHSIVVHESDTTGNMTTNLEDLGDAADELFYQKLLQLKEAHKKTLNMYEQLYEEKRDGDTGSNHADGRISRSRLASLENLLGDNINDNSQLTGKDDANQHQFVSHRVTKDSVRDLSTSKPPSGRPKTSEGTPVRSSNTVRSHTANETTSDGGSLKQRSFLSEDFVDCATSEDEQHKENWISLSSRSHIDTRQSAMDRIGDMWERFSVDNYCPRSSGSKTKPGMFRSNSMSRLSLGARDVQRSRPSTTDHGPAKKQSTVPKPFSMSMREANRTPRKSKAAIELEQREEERRYAEELECQKKFKAMPLPAHVHLRLFEELNEERETRRRFIVQHRQEILHTVQKPFTFTLREEERCKTRRASEGVNNMTRGRPQFRAHPVPKRIFDDSVVEKIREEEEYRKIRMKMRAKELLRSSSLPPTMKLKGRDYTDGRQRQKLYAERAKKAGITVEHKFRPKINRKVPDFDKIYDNFMRDLAQTKKYLHEPTVCKPFNLRTSMGQLSGATKTSRSSFDNSSIGDDSFDQSRLVSKSFSGRLPTSKSFTAGTYSAPFDVIPSKTNSAAEVRSSANKLRIQKKVDEEEAKRKKVEQQLIGADKRLKKTIQERTPQIDRTTVHNEIKERLKIRQIEDRRRVQDYKKQLKEMNHRIKERPLLFEQTAQKNARQAAERKYNETLGRSGLDEEFLARQGHTASSVSVAEEVDEEASEATLSRRSSVQPTQSRYSPRSPSPVDRRSPGRSPGRGSLSQRSHTASEVDYNDESRSNSGDEIQEEDEEDV